MASTSRRARIAPLMAVAVAMAVGPVGAQVRVSPTGVSVNAMGATTVFLTFGGLRDQQPAESFWCGELVTAAPARGFKCDPETLFGRLPARYDLSRLGAGVLTDIMSIPPSVTRLAYQAAVGGAISSFFYVRRFRSLTGGPDEYVAVTCRLTGGGARVPFSLTNVRIAFDGQPDVLFVAPGDAPPLLSARITYTGTGRLVGRWEVVFPGEAPPASEDLLSEASLPPDARGSQRRYAQLERFNVFLPPDGTVTLPGPDPRRLPSATEGTYRVLLRVEATDDREGDSNLADAGAGAGLVHSGAVAGFPLPVLLYVVAGEGARTKPGDVGALRLIAPRDSAVVRADSEFTVAWSATERADYYRVDFETDRGVALLSALLPRVARTYQVPPNISSTPMVGPIRWRVTALSADGSPRQRSVWRIIRTDTTLPGARSSGASRVPAP